MSEGIRVRIGSDIRYLPATATQAATAYASVVKNNWERGEGGKLTKLDPTWFEARWTGKLAETLREQHQKGDALLLIGNAAERMEPSTEGNDRLVRRFFVNAFGSDAAKSQYVVQRAQSKETEAAQVVTQEAEVDQSADFAAQQAREVQVANVNAAETELHRRLTSLVSVGRATPENAAAIMSIYSGQKRDAAVAHSAAAFEAEQRLGAVEVEWISSVTSAPFTGEAYGSWEQAEAKAQARLAAATAETQAETPAYGVQYQQSPVANAAASNVDSRVSQWVDFAENWASAYVPSTPSVSPVGASSSVSPHM